MVAVVGQMDAPDCPHTLLSQISTFFPLQGRTSCSWSLWASGTADGNMTKPSHKLFQACTASMKWGQMNHLPIQCTLPCWQFRTFKGGLKIRAENLCVPESCPALDFTSLNCDYREVSPFLLLIIHKQLLKGEVYNYLLKEWAWPIFWVI